MEQQSYAARCRRIVELAERPSQAQYAQSVLEQIERQPLLYPTVAQIVVLDRILGHLERQQQRAQWSDAERDAREALGLRV